MPSMIQVEHLVKNYGTFTAVDDISFDVEAGEIFAFLGPNGAGKTTTIKILTTLLKATSGKVEIDGLDPTTNQNEVRKRFGIVFQDPSLDDELTAFENMDIHGVLYKVPRRIRTERIESLLKLVELWDRRNDRAEHFPGACVADWKSLAASCTRPRFSFSTSRRSASTRRRATICGRTSASSTRRST